MYNGLKTRKGQLFSEDFVLSMVLVLFLLTMLIMVSDAVTSRIDANEAALADNEFPALASSALVEGPGHPKNWETAGEINLSSVYSIGLASSANVIDPVKAARFFNLSRDSKEYNETRILLGLTRYNYRYNASLSYLNGTKLMELNASPMSSSHQIHGLTNVTASSKRLVLYNNTIMRFELNVWKE